MRTEIATQRKIKIGEDTSRELLDYLRENPDKTIYDLSKTLNWSIGKVQKALLRIEGNLRVEQNVEGGRFKRKYSVAFAPPASLK
jgi:predicted transcriptional regulator